MSAFFFDPMHYRPRCLTKTQCGAIRHFRSSGWTISRLATQFNVGVAVISRVCQSGRPILRFCKCSTCGTRFKTNIVSQWCSTECVKVAKNQKRNSLKAIAQAPIHRARSCPECSSKFRPKFSTHKFCCKECQRTNEFSEGRKRRFERAEEKRPCSKCGRQMRPLLRRQVMGERICAVCAYMPRRRFANCKECGVRIGRLRKRCSDCQKAHAKAYALARYYEDHENNKRKCRTRRQKNCDANLRIRAGNRDFILRLNEQGKADFLAIGEKMRKLCAIATWKEGRQA